MTLSPEDQYCPIGSRVTLDAPASPLRPESIKSNPATNGASS